MGFFDGLVVEGEPEDDPPFPVGLPVELSVPSPEFVEEEPPED